MQDSQRFFDSILQKVEEIARGSDTREVKLTSITELLKRSIEYYDWVGFYFVNPENERELILGPFAGEHTEHRRILVGTGVCGQVAESQQKMIVQNVEDEDNYLSCSPLVKSEMVLPIFVDGKFVGELDIDSHTPEPFTEIDNRMLERICKIAGELLKPEV